LYFAYKHISFKSDVEIKLKREIEKSIETELNRVGEKLEAIKEIAVSLAKELGSPKLNKGDIEKLLQEKLKGNPNLVGIGVAFEPMAFDEKTKLFAPYYQVEDGKIVSTPITYDYTKPSKSKLKPEINWYANPLSKGEAWVEPYYVAEKKIVVGEYATAFFRDGGDKKKPIGIVFINFNLNAIKDLISYLRLGKTGYGFLLSKNGLFISHHIDEYVVGQKTIADLEKKAKNISLISLGKKMLLGGTGIFDYVDQINEDIEKKSWAFLYQIKHTGWHFAAIYFKDEVFAKHIKRFKQNQILVIIAILFFLLFLLLGIAYSYSSNKKLLIVCSTVSSLFLVVGIAMICKFGFDEGLSASENQSIITSQADMMAFFKSKEGQTNIEQPLYIPTGVIVNHAEFLDIDSIHISGYLWQKYPRDTKDNNLPKFSFEKAVSSDIEIKKIYLQDDKKVVEMSFKCVLPVVTQYGKYPFDYQRISLQLASKDRVGSLVLVPDFQAYSIITPSSLPGVSKRISLNGWNLQKSFFAYNPQFSEVTYGLYEETIKNKPLFSFNIIIKRRILQPLLSIILPLIIILFLVFILLLVADRLNIVTLFSANSALILSIIFSHVAIREKLPISGFFYLEYFYLVSYLLIVLVSLSIFYTFKSGLKIPFLQYKDNLISKLLYWPIALLIILLLTIQVFYY